MKNLLILIMTCIAFATIVPEASAQRMKDFEAYSFDEGTMISDTSSSNTLLFEFPKNVTGRFDADWHCKVVNLTGTSAGNVYLEVANCGTCSDWTTYTSFALSSTMDTLIHINQVPGIRIRARYASSGTGTGTVKNHVSMRNLDN